MSQFGQTDFGQTEQRQAGQPGKAHWAGRPAGLLAAVLAARLLLSLFWLGVGALVALLNPGGESGRIVAYGVSFVEIAATLLTGVLFYRWIRVLQFRHQAEYPIRWKPGAVFWIGIVLALGSGMLANFEYAQYQPVSAALNFTGSLASGLATILFLMLLIPVMERRFGIFAGALVVIAAFAAVAAVERLAARFIASLVLPEPALTQVTRTVWSETLMGLLRSTLLSAAGTAVSIVVCLAASRRVLGAWPLAFAVNGLLQLLNHAVADSLIDGGVIAARSASLAVDVPFDAAVLMLGIGVLFCFQRWATLRKFGRSVKRLVGKMRASQEVE